MTDFVGNELRIGDEIVYCRSRKNGMDMIKTRVVGFTDKMVKIEKLRSWSDKQYALAAPYNCVVYEQRRVC